MLPFFFFSFFLYFIYLFFLLDKITNIDTSNDGKWIIATCDKYLILLPAYSCQEQEKDAYANTLKYEDRRIPVKI